MRSAPKELFIVALLLMIVVFMIGMVFYKYMPNNKTVPEPVTYSADATTTSILQEISASSSSYSDESGENEVAQDVIKSYSIGQSELTSAAAKQTYVSGKTNPFAEYQAPTANTVDANGNTVANTNTVNQNPNTQPAQQQAQPQPAQAKTDPNSTGTFFEKKGSK